MDRNLAFLCLGSSRCRGMEAELSVCFVRLKSILFFDFAFYVRDDVRKKKDAPCFNALSHISSKSLSLAKSRRGNKRQKQKKKGKTS